MRLYTDIDFNTTCVAKSQLQPASPTFPAQRGRRPGLHRRDGGRRPAGLAGGAREGSGGLSGRPPPGAARAHGPGNGT